MRILIFFLVLILNAAAACAQDRLMAKNGSISFYSKTSLEDIEANTQTAMSVLDKKTGQIEILALIKSFSFEKALMQEHFNENYMESDKFPKSSFKGRFDDLTKVDFNKDGKYNASVSGDLTIHGVARSITIPVTIIVKNGVMSARADFNISLADYKVNIPSLVRDKISKTIQVSVNINYSANAL